MLSGGYTVHVQIVIQFISDRKVVIKMNFLKKKVTMLLLLPEFSLSQVQDGNYLHNVLNVLII